MADLRILSGLNGLPLDDQFIILLHKKLLSKKGSNKRRLKKYYKDKYKKSGVIPGPLLLAGEGVMEGRKCSGRPRTLSEPVKERFVEMIEASCDLDDERFIFITQKARKIINYHKWLEKEFNRAISLPALRRYVKEKKLMKYLEKPDFEAPENPEPYFDTEPVFGLIQMDGSLMKYFVIRNEEGLWQPPRVIEFYDTGSRYMFLLDFFFSENSANSVELFIHFLLDRPFPMKTIRFRPDRAGGFWNLKRPIMDLNLRFSMPGGFHLKPDFARAGKAKDKAHLESSHRALHNFEIRIIKEFEDRIVKLKPGYTFKNRRKEPITVTCLDIDIDQLRKSNILEEYRKEHNNRKHNFAQEGKTIAWKPSEKLEIFLKGYPTIEFLPEDVQDLIQYGFEKKPATVTTKRFITYRKQRYYVAAGAEKFSQRKSTKVKISDVNDKLLIFDDKDDGVLLGEALCQKAPDKPKSKPGPKLPLTEIEKISAFLKNKGMIVDNLALIERHRKGLNLAFTKNIYAVNKPRYDKLSLKLNPSKQKTGVALFNAFVLDCDRCQRKTHVAPYAPPGGTYK